MSGHLPGIPYSRSCLSCFQVQRKVERQSGGGGGNWGWSVNGNALYAAFKCPRFRGSAPAVVDLQMPQLFH